MPSSSNYLAVRLDCIKIGGVDMRINGFGFERGEDPPTSEELATA